MYLISIFAGVLAVLGILACAADEKWIRRKRISEHLSTRLVLQVPGQKAEYVDLWSGHYTIGRRRRRNDLAFIHDPAVSREHAILWLDQTGCWNIRPIYHRKKRGQEAYYSEVVVGMSFVPAAGKTVTFGDEIRIGNSRITLEQMKGESE